MFYDILDGKRKDILPLFADFKSDFYLAGGTALALQLGHRDSVDFDFFTESHFDTAKLYERMREAFQGKTLVKVQDEKDTLTVIVEGTIKVSFFRYAYPLLESLIDEPFLRIASVTDIGCMKLSAIVSRATRKDYVDLYYILRQIRLDQLFVKLGEKMPDLDHILVLKSLLYFDDITEDKILFRHSFDIAFSKVTDFLAAEAKRLVP